MVYDVGSKQIALQKLFLDLAEMIDKDEMKGMAVIVFRGNEPAMSHLYDNADIDLERWLGAIEILKDYFLKQTYDYDDF